MTLRFGLMALSALSLVLATSQASASASKVSQACEADFHKLCPSAKVGRGAAMRCVKGQLDQVTPDCKGAVQTAQAARAARKAAKAAAKANTASTASPS